MAKNIIFFFFSDISVTGSIQPSSKMERPVLNREARDLFYMNIHFLKRNLILLNVILI